LGTTHHEAGTLAKGEVASNSVTLPDCRIRHITKAARHDLHVRIGA
jgi:hypothetical protein